MFGEWLSLVEHLVRDQGVGGSNPLSPTIKIYNLQIFITICESTVDDSVAVQACKPSRKAVNARCCERSTSF